MPRKKTEIRPIMTRMAEGLRRRLAAAAKLNDQSMNSEITMRLDKSFDLEDDFGGPDGKHVVYLMASAFIVAGEREAKARKISQWITDPNCFSVAMFAVFETLLVQQPEASEEQISLQIESLKGRISTRFANRKTMP